MIIGCTYPVCAVCGRAISLYDGPYATLSDGRSICSKCLWEAAERRKAGKD